MKKETNYKLQWSLYDDMRIIAIKKNKEDLMQHIPDDFVEYDGSYVDPKAIPFYESDEDFDTCPIDICYGFLSIEETDIIL